MLLTDNYIHVTNKSKLDNDILIMFKYDNNKETY